jgi:uncharacterized Tic20 family protein
VNDILNEQTPKTGDETNWAVIAHVSALAGVIFPFGNILGPLVVLLTKGKESAFVGDHAREALNFQITVLLMFFVLGSLLMFLLFGAISMHGGFGMGHGIGFGAAFFLMPIIMIANLILIIVAAAAASKGEQYHYPLNLRLVK